MITGLNHITLAVSDISRSLAFYTELLNFQPHARWDTGAYLSCGGVWLCLTLDEVCPTEDYTHLAFSIAEGEFASVVSALLSADVKIWKSNKSEGSSLYFLDPDQHKLEIHDGDLASRLHAVDQSPYPGWVRLDVPK